MPSYYIYRNFISGYVANIVLSNILLVNISINTSDASIFSSTQCVITVTNALIKNITSTGTDYSNLIYLFEIYLTSTLTIINSKF